MPKLIALLVTSLLLATSSFASACSLRENEPSYIFQNSDSLVLARPLKISPDPAETEPLKGNYSYSQSVIWQIVSSWKGSRMDGETFIDTSRIDTQDPCSGWGVIRDYQPRIFYSIAGSYFHLYYVAPVGRVVPQLDALKEEDAKSRK